MNKKIHKLNKEKRQLQDDLVKNFGNSERVLSIKDKRKKSIESKKDCKKPPPSTQNIRGSMKSQTKKCLVEANNQMIQIQNLHYGLRNNNQARSQRTSMKAKTRKQTAEKSPEMNRSPQMTRNELLTSEMNDSYIN